MKKITREFKIGCFVLAVLLISFFVINFLRGKDIFNREMYVVSSYDNIEGLVPSDFGAPQGMWRDTDGFPRIFRADSFPQRSFSFPRETWRNLVTVWS